MAIDTLCPHCKKGYKLKDDLVGKKVTCANKDCRQVFVVTPSAPPAPVAATNGVAAPKKAAAPKPKPIAASIDAEAIAAAALSEAAQVDGEKVIAMTCAVCDHKWNEPWDRQGKNVLCPDCKHRQKVPMQKEGADWRASNAPKGAKIEKLDDVVGGDSSMISEEAMRKGGILVTEYEPRPLSFYVKILGGVAVVLGMIVGGVMMMMKRGAEVAGTKQLADYQKSLDTDELKGMPLYRAALHLALGEAEARHPEAEKHRNKAVDFFKNALVDLNSMPMTRAYDRDQLFTELANGWFLLGGSGADLTEKRKLSWLPPTPGGGSRTKVRADPIESDGIQGQIRRVFQGLRETNAEFDVRAAFLRSVTRTALKYDQLEVVTSCLGSLFSPNELFEAEGQMGLECVRAGKTNQATDIANRLKTTFTGAALPEAIPAAASVVALWKVSEPEIKGPSLVSSPGGGTSEVGEGTCWAYTAIALIQKKPDDAKTMAARGRPDARLKALALAAEWTEKPTDFINVAAAVKPKDGLIALGPVYARLAFAAGRSGQTPELANDLIKIIPDENLRVFAKAEALRGWLSSDRSIQPKDTDAEVPMEAGDLKKWKLGHAWGRYWLARHNAARTGDAALPSQYSDSWPKTLVAPFGQLGATLGLMDHK
jgi:hypothetical protein